MSRASAAYASPDTVAATDSVTAPFWQAARENRLAVPCCSACGTFRMPPTVFCPKCRSKEVGWPTLSGAAVLYSFTVIDRAPKGQAPEFYVPAIVELPDAPGVRLITNIVTDDIDGLAIGTVLAVHFVPIAEGGRFPAFRPVHASS